MANLFVGFWNTPVPCKGQKFDKKVFSANAKDAVTKIPVVTLVNQGTAGAAELTAGALLDNHRTQLVGTKTFGSGSFQKLIPMEDGSGLVISIAKYHTPSGTEIQDNGIKPSVEVLQPSEEIFNPDDEGEVVQASKIPGTEEDRQLKKALEILKDPSKAAKPGA